MKRLTRKVVKEFQTRFGDDFILVESPGRVNLIGEHTDYNEGFVLPAAVNKSIVLALTANNTNKAEIYSVDNDETFEAVILDDLKKSDLGWPNYILGIMDQLQKLDYEPKGFDCVFGGNVPIGAGMSSSAALECGILFGLNELFDLEISPVQMAQLAQKAENNFVGVKCGVMDQFVSLNGRKGCVLKLDCRSLDYVLYPFNRKDVHIVLCDTGVRRELVSSEYNTRRQQCEAGVMTLQRYDEKIRSLRDVNLDLLEEYKNEMEPVVYKRCRFVIEENERVHKACEDLKKGDLISFGERMYASHKGLRDQYEVSCKELNLLAESALNIEGVLGARMMGGGFGGCTINLVEEDHLERVKAYIKDYYKKETGYSSKIYQTQVSGGTHLVEHKKVTISS